MRAYPAALTPDPDGGFTVTFHDVPEAITEGDTREEALLRAEDALESALAMHIAAEEPLPTSSQAKVRRRSPPPTASSRVLPLAPEKALRHRAGIGPQSNYKQQRHYRIVETSCRTQSRGRSPQNGQKYPIGPILEQFPL
jgi:predicted RNase H-like HicB family nuclease